MKIDNKGITLRMMIICSSIIFLFFLIALFFIIRVYGKLPINNEDDFSYENLETNLVNAGLIYVERYYIVSEDTLVISVNNLVSEGLSEIPKDKSGKECNGYVLVNQKEKKAYLKCPNYKTSGYQDWRTE